MITMIIANEDIILSGIRKIPVKLKKKISVRYPTARNDDFLSDLVMLLLSISCISFSSLE